MFIVVLSCLLLVGVFVFNKAKRTVPDPQNVNFAKLQRQYLIAYFLATFSDWLQGPYVYKVYSDYGYDEEEIAVLYIAGFASSFLFGVIVGHLADKYGRKQLCLSFGLTYSLCCLTKTSSRFYVLFIGRLLGGVSTSILFSTFEAWYINEHINHYHFPPEWLNHTFSKASFYTGFLAILAGIISQIFVETLNLGPTTPFILAIPFLLISTHYILFCWKEHFTPTSVNQQALLAPLVVICLNNRLLLLLGLIQSAFEAVMYTFIFSWTPVLSDLDPPLGIVFACFMLAFMIGSTLYSLLLSGMVRPQLIMVYIVGLSMVCFSFITIVIGYLSYNSVSDLIQLKTVLIQICFLCFVLYEMCLGMYFPALSYLKGTVVPEEFRASIANWFRVPMNMLTCVCITINQFKKPNPQSDQVFSNFYMIYISCSTLLAITTAASIVFQRKYTKKYCKDAPFSENSDPVNESSTHSTC